MRNLANLLRATILEEIEYIKWFDNKYFDNNNVRSAELRSPINPAHLARTFGASDRNSIDGSHKNASVTQLFFFLNMATDSWRFIRPDSDFILNIKEMEFPQDTNYIYQTFLVRAPTQKELDQFEVSTRWGHLQGIYDTLWLLVNSNEFIFKT